MAVSSAALIQRVRNYLDERPYVSTGTLADAVDVTCAVTDGTGWDEGAIVEFQDNGEQCLVQSVSGNVLTVVRGWNGTTAAAHTSIQVFRDPIYTYNTILQAVNAAVRKLWPYAYKIGTDSITPAPTTTVWYALDDGLVMDLVAVQQVYGSLDQHVGVFGKRNSGRSVVYAENLPTTISSTGKALKFPYGFWDNTNVVDVKYRAVITGTTDIEDDGRLPVAEVVVYGALELLFLGAEGKRVGEGEDIEPARSVRAGARAQLAAQYGSLFRQGLQVLKLKHEALYPPMRVKG